MRKKWLVPSFNDPHTLVVVEANEKAKPADAVAECPIDPMTGEAEEAEWLTVQQIDGENVAVVDTGLKTSVLANRQATKDALAAAKADRLVEVTRLFARADSFNKQELVTISDVQDAIADIVQVLRFITENDRPQGG